MFDSHFTFDTCGYDLTLKRDRDWKVSKNRMLIILQTVDTADLKNQEIASTPLLVNCLKAARAEARQWGKIPDFSFAVVNFNDDKHLHIRGTGRRDAERAFAERVRTLIDKLNPTHILFSGDGGLVFPLQESALRNGWVLDIDKRKVTTTLDLARLTEKGGAFANLLGFWIRDCANLMLGDIPYTLKDLPNKPIYVKDLKTFEKVMKVVDESEYVALDTETRNLSVNHNKIHTIQLCCDKMPSRGFVIPYEHPSGPFTDADRHEIRQQLVKRLLNNKSKVLVTFNGMYDLRVLRSCLSLLLIKAKVWEITSGEHLIDENVAALADIGIKRGGLAATFSAYGNDHYYKAKFSKDDRGNTASISPDDPDFLEYASMDVVSIMAIKQAQIDRAAKIDLDGKNFKPLFIRHMLHQMSDTAHQTSHLRQDGSLVSKTYLKTLMAKGSELDKEIERLLQELYNHPDVIKANQQILDESGFKTGSLFGNKTSWMLDLGKVEHRRKLFFDVLGLPPIGKTKSGGDALDKNYIAHYKDKSLVVAMYGDYQEAQKLMSTYVRRWYRRLRKDLDAALDSYLRPDYSAYDVATGRLASKNPNLQNIPARGKLAKIIKAMFRAPKGHLLIRFDYSAHEVRMWSVAARDRVLADVFRKGQTLRKAWIKNPTQENMDAIKKEGDAHILNVLRFFKKLVDKNHPLRDAVKAVVFGVLYGKSARSLGEDTKKTEIQDLRKEINKLYAAVRAGDKAALAQAHEIEDKLTALLEEDRREYAQGIIDKMFAEFNMGYKWMKRMSALAEEKGYVYSPIGRRR